MSTEFMKVSECATALGVTSARAYQMIWAGLIPHVRNGRTIIIPRRAWNEWLEEQNAAARASVRHEQEIGGTSEAA